MSFLHPVISRERLRSIFRNLPWHVITTGTISAFVTLNSIPSGKLVIGGDEILPSFNPSIALSHLGNTWDSAAGLGGDSTFARPLLFPFILVDWLFAKLGASPALINNSWVVAIYVIQALSCLYLFRVLFPTISKAISTFVGLLSVVNPYMLLTYHTPYPTTALSIAVVPAVIASSIRLQQKFDVPRLLSFVFFALIMATGDNNLGVTASEFILVAPALIIISMRIPELVLRTRFLISTLLSLAAANFYLLLPVFEYAKNNFGSDASAAASSSLSTLQVTSEYSGLSNSGRLIGDYLFFNPVGGRPYILQGQEYLHAPWLILATWVLPILAVLGVFLFRRNFTARIVAIFTLVGLLLAKGGGAPLGGPFVFLFTHVSVFQAFRDSFSKFGWVPMYGYSLLAGLCLARIWQLRSKMSVVGLSCVCIMGPAVGSYPVLTGGLFATQALTNIPARYYAMAAWFNHMKNPGAILDMPVSPYAFDTYRWGYVGAGLLPNMIERPFVSRMFDFSSEETEQIDDAFQNFSTNVGIDNIASLLEIYGIKYVVADPSIDPQYFSPNFTSEILTETPPGMKLVKRFGSIRIYEVSARPNPIVYAPNHIYSTSKPIDTADMMLLCHLDTSGCTGSAFISSVEAKESLGAKVKVSDNLTDRSRGVSNFIEDSSETNSEAQSNLRSLSAEADDSTRGVLKHPVQICSNQKSINQVTFNVSNSSNSRPSLFSLHYRSAKLNPIVYVTIPNESSYLQVALPKSNVDHTFSRVMDFGSANTVTVQISVAPNPANYCLTLSQIAIDALPKSVQVHLLPDTNNFESTPLTVGTNPNELSALANGRLRPVTATSNVNSVSTTSDTALDWNFTDVFTSSSGASSNPSIGQSQNGFQLFRVKNGKADVHEWLGGLVPGGNYQVSFTYRVVSGQTPTFAIVDDQGELLLTQEMSNSTGLHKVSANFEVPENSSTVLPYVYLQSEANGQGAIELSSLHLRSDSQAPYISIAGHQTVSTPKSIHILKAGSTEYDLKVLGAPQRYLLVLNSTYSREWNLSAASNDVRVRHFAVNQGVNGWIITGGNADQTLKLSYQGNDLVVWGETGSAVFLILSMGVVIQYRRSSRRCV